ncbi:Na+/H+ antiporter subunit E [Streptomonospora litoralis]|uniref:Putative monovalent cation/H+ antiporter subunit E n=1 Tax=Streptomonospora litoralis TaxID=2498135 RepID=A0A4P6Q7Y0_9ACTN|nr:Na+/H+ antiporter subunit E [Streptomonospora litoralis]QBI55259.1 putative monovalent cation/H+ antiporter subunit E [Streptomonospora litoralis]
MSTGPAVRASAPGPGRERPPSPLQRLLRRLPMLLWLTLMWVVLWGDASPGTVLAGAGVASGCYAVTRLPHLPVRLRFRPLHALLLVGHISLELLASSIRVAAHALWRPARMRGAIVAVPMRTDSDLLLVMVTAGLSLITGSLVIELNREEGVLYVHGTPVQSARAVRKLRRQVRHTEERFVRAFGTAADVEEFEREERLMREAESQDAGEESR